MPADEFGPLDYSVEVVNFAGLSHSEHASMVPAGGHIKGTAKSPVRWATCSSAGGYFRRRLSVRLHGGTTNQHQHETSRQQSAGTSSCDPRTRLRDATLRVPCSGLGHHYFWRSMHALAFLRATTLETGGNALVIARLCFYAASSLSVALSSAINKRASAPVGATNRDPAA